MGTVYGFAFPVCVAALAKPPVRTDNWAMREFMVINRMRPETGSERLIAFIVRWLITAAGVWVAAKLVGGIHLDGWQTTLIVALILGALERGAEANARGGHVPAADHDAGAVPPHHQHGAAGADGVDLREVRQPALRDRQLWRSVLGAVLISVVSFLITRFIDPKRIALSFG